MPSWQVGTPDNHPDPNCDLSASITFPSSLCFSLSPALLSYLLMERRTRRDSDACPYMSRPGWASNRQLPTLLHRWSSMARCIPTEPAMAAGPRRSRTASHGRRCLFSYLSVLQLRVEESISGDYRSQLMERHTYEGTFSRRANTQPDNNFIYVIGFGLVQDLLKSITDCFAVAARHLLSAAGASSLQPEKRSSTGTMPR